LGMSRRSDSGADGCMRFKKEGQACKVKKKGANMKLDLKTRAVLQLVQILKVTCINTYDFIPFAKKHPQCPSANTTNIILPFLAMPLVLKAVSHSDN
jgi:hypothetical protein